MATSPDRISGQVLKAIMTLTEAGSWSNAKRVVMQRPELLSAEAEEMLQRVAAFEPNPDRKGLLQSIGEVLQRCKVEGIEVAFGPLVQREAPPQLAVLNVLDIAAEIREMGALFKQVCRDPNLFQERRIKSVVDLSFVWRNRSFS